jgi:hypothetical protein
MRTAPKPNSTTLGMADGSLVQQDAGSVLAIFKPLKAFGPAPYGPLKFRAVEANGREKRLAATGDAGAGTNTERSALPGRSGEAVFAERDESVSVGFRVG